jgi:hypothetical protein
MVAKAEKNPLRIATEFLNKYLDRTDASVWLAIVLKNNDTTVE